MAKRPLKWTGGGGGGFNSGAKGLMWPEPNILFFNSLSLQFTNSTDMFLD